MRDRISFFVGAEPVPFLLEAALRRLLVVGRQEISSFCRSFGPRRLMLLLMTPPTDDFADLADMV